MKDFTETLQMELLLRLEDLDKNYDPRNLADTRLDVIVTAIEQIKQKLKPYRFPSAEDEIHYFKNVLPETLALHIYYSDRIEWDRIRALGSPECKYKFADHIFSQAENFRSDHKDFCNYCRDGNSHLDKFYFLRNSPGNRERVYPLRSIIDPNSPTIYCEMRARLLAYSRMERELHSGISQNKDEPAAVHSNQPVLLLWTLPKICLIEILYALKEFGAFNHGKADLVLIQACFEKMFGISLGNISRSFQEILSRKKGHTSFLDKLRQFLLNKIIKIEENNMKMGGR